jgi:hypothetical protein
LITLGVRADRLPGESDVTVDPRIAVSRRLGAWTARMSGGLFHQGRWRGDAAIPDAGTPSGMPRTVSHLVAGLERNTSQTFVRVEAFMKQYADYRAFGAGPAIDASTARGIDMLVQRTGGKISGFAGYSLLDASSRLRDGQRARSAFDVAHSVTTSVTAALSHDWSIGTTARYGSGAPHTPITGNTRTSDGRLAPVYGKLMSESLPSYARLDARVMRYIRTPAFLLTTFAEILNVTERQNVSMFTYDPSFTSRQPVHTFFSKRTVVLGGELMFR